ncbi:MAG: hypothetical protein ABIQ15_03635 [Nocardioides sp.]
MSADELDPHVSRWLEQVDARWRRVRLDPSVRARLLLELVDDLRQAIDSGAAPADLTRPDPSEFADDVAAAAGGVVRPRPAHGRTTAGTTDGTTSLLRVGLVGAVLSAWLVYRAAATVPNEVWPAYLLAQVVAPFLVALGAWCACRFWRRPGPPGNASLRFMAVGMGIAGLLGVWPSMAMDATVGLHNPEYVVGTQVVLAAACCLLGGLTGVSVAQSSRWRR